MSFPENPFRKQKQMPVAEKKAKVLPIWCRCEVGESWLVEDYSNRNPYLAACVHGRRFGKKFTSKREGYGLRITRVA